jgi:hypothetical protein
MDDPREEANDLTKREMDIENDLDRREYEHKIYRNQRLNELARIRMRQGELLRLYGVK